MGKKRIIAETGAGQHGVATARQALFGWQCIVYRARDIGPAAERFPHAPAGAKVVCVPTAAARQGRYQRGHARS